MTKTWTKRQQANHRKKWIAALRSGEYRQTRGKLTNGKGFCCLGLACEISGLGWWEDGVAGQWAYRAGPEDWSGSRLPDAVKDWLGLSGNLGQYNNYFRSLSDDNDDRRLRFKTIADIIESEPEGLIAK